MTQKWVIPGIPNTGRKLFCLVNSLHMLFQHQGENIPLHRLIPMTGVAFGFRYLNDGRFVHPVVMGCTCAAALAFTSRQLAYEWDIVADNDWKTAWGRIRESLIRNLPVAIGPIPYAILSYNPRAGEELRGDHFCVLCGFDEEKDTVWVNDPDGFSYAPLSLSALGSVWQSPQHLCPVLPQAPLAMMVTVKAQPEHPGESLKAVLGRACRLMRGEIVYDPLEATAPPRFIFTGIPGEEKLAADIRSRFDGADSRRLTQITRRMQEVTFLQGTQAKADIAHYLLNWAHRILGKGENELLLDISKLYERESSLYLEALKSCSVINKEMAMNTTTDQPWNELAQIMSDIAFIERKALVSLEELIGGSNE